MTAERLAVAGIDVTALSEGCVVVFYAPLVVSDDIRDWLVGALDSDEEARAQTFLDRRDADRFVVGRGSVRAVLARCAGIAPEAVRFTYGPNGKPELALSDGAGPLWFNVSHSGDRLALAASTCGPVGIDIEQLRPMPDAEDLALRVLSTGELATFTELPVSQRDAAFLLAWVRKEACLKATGSGFSVPASDFEVLGLPDTGGAEPITEIGVEGRTWRLYSLFPGDGFVGAVVASGSIGRIATFDMIWRAQGEWTPTPRTAP